MIVDIVDKIIQYENGEMSDVEMYDFFQEIIDSGLVWQLQGSYGRMAELLIDQGQCEYKSK